jgi:hypothetical protein
MVKIIKEIPDTTATRIVLPKSRPMISIKENQWLMTFPKEQLVVHPHFHVGVYRLCGLTPQQVKNSKNSELEDRVEATNKEKNIILRLKDQYTPIAAVSDKFKELDLKVVKKRVEDITHKKPVIRYFPDQERIQFIFPVSKLLGGLHLFLDSGNYGTYGGSGRNAIRYGIAWPNSKSITHETSALLLQRGSIIHLEGPTFERKINNVLTSTKQIVDLVEESKDNFFTPEEVAHYLAHHQSDLHTKVTNPLYKRTFKPKDISAYDVATELTHRADTTVVDRVKINAEYLAGKVILSYATIKEKTKVWVADAEKKKRETPTAQKLI